MVHLEHNTNEKNAEQPYIELNTFLKYSFFISTGGQAKQHIQNKEVLVNGTVETRNKRKLYGGENITFMNQTKEVDKKNIKRKKNKAI